MITEPRNEDANVSCWFDNSGTIFYEEGTYTNADIEIIERLIAGGKLKTKSLELVYIVREGLQEYTLNGNPQEWQQ